MEYKIAICDDEQNQVEYVIDILDGIIKDESSEYLKKWFEKRCWLFLLFCVHL